MIFGPIHRVQRSADNSLQLYCSFCQVKQQFIYKRIPELTAESFVCPYLFWVPSWVDTQSTDFDEDRISQCSISETHHCVHLLQKWSPAWRRHQSLFAYQPLKRLSPTSFYWDHNAPCCKYKETSCEAWILVTFEFHATRNLHLSEVHLVLPTSIITHRNNATLWKSAWADDKLCGVAALHNPTAAHKKLKPVLSPQKHQPHPRVLRRHKAAEGSQQSAAKKQF